MPNQLDLFDTTVLYCDDVPVVNLDQFYSYVTRELTATATDGTCAVSPPIPLRSGGGWYVGRASFNFDAASKRWWFEPFDRISDYYATMDQAADAASWHRWGVPSEEAEHTLARSALAVGDISVTNHNR